MIYILLGYIALSWIASFIAMHVPKRYTKVLVFLFVFTNPFFIIYGIEFAILEKRKSKVLNKESKGGVYEE